MKNKFFITLCLFFISFSVFSTKYHGHLKVLVVDYVKEKKSETIYELIDGNTSYKLKLPDNIDKSFLLSGVEVTIEGKVLFQGNSKRIKVENIHRDSSLAPATTQIPRAINYRKNIALLVDFTDIKTSQTLSVKDVDSILYKADDSTKINYERSTFNQESLNPDTNNDGVSDIYPIQLSYAAGSTCDYDKWATDALSAAKKQGINLSLYQFNTIVLPSDISCTWGGIASLGCGDTCTAWIRSYSTIYSKIVFAHELGHLLGLNHSAIDANNDGITEDEYGDETCFMGSGNFGFWKELNAPHRDQMNYLAAYPDSLKTITQSGQYTIYPLESGVANKQLLMLKFLKADSSEYYYLSLRTNIGPFGPGVTNAVNKVSIHHAPAASTGLTYFIKGLNVRDTFVDNVNKINVTVLSIDNNSATVQVNLNTDAAKVQAFTFYKNDNTASVGYTDWDKYYWKGNCPAYSEPVGLSADVSSSRPESIACLIKDSATSTATGTYVRTLGSYTGDRRSFSRNGDWDVSYFKWECDLNEYVSGISQDTVTNQIHQIRCAKGTFTNGGQNLCETRFVRNNGDDRGSSQGNDWAPGYNKGQCSDGKIIFGVSVNLANFMPHKILCCSK